MEMLKIFTFCHVLGQEYATQLQFHSRDMASFWSLTPLCIWPKPLYITDKKQTSA